MNALTARAGRMARRLTSRWRPLPGVIIIGAQRSGTTSLFDVMRRHDEIEGAAVKEIHFFDEHFRRGLSWYRSFFRVPHEDSVLPMEATPFYLAHPHAPQRIAQHVPDAKLIALLRDPTSRAISHYRYSVALGREPLPFLEALKAEEERIDDEWNRMVQDPRYTSPRFRAYSYKHRGRYAEQIDRFLEHVPADQILLLNMGDLVARPHTLLSQISQFLDIADFPEDIVVSKRNASSTGAVDDPEAVEYLNAYFEPLNEHLARDHGISFEETP